MEYNAKVKLGDNEEPFKEESWVRLEKAGGHLGSQWALYIKPEGGSTYEEKARVELVYNTSFLVWSGSLTGSNSVLIVVRMEGLAGAPAWIFGMVMKSGRPMQATWGAEEGGGVV